MKKKKPKSDNKKKRGRPSKVDYKLLNPYNSPYVDGLLKKTYDPKYNPEKDN